jgi:5-methylthioadenosine/S-adenosylhomocysteine deaminase
MAHGIPCIQQALDAGVHPSLSVDAETNAPNDMFTQMRLALASQHTMLMARKAAGEENLPARLTARDALALATIEGAKTNGLEARTGSLTPGKQADLILLHRDKINVMPVNDPVGAVVYGMDTSNVDSVYVGGRARKQAGQLVGADLAHIAEQVITSRDYLASKAANG